MIDKFGYTYTLSCDLCGNEAPETFFDFYEAVDYKKHEGWKSQKDNNDNWMDVCPECVSIGRDLEWD